MLPFTVGSELWRFNFLAAPSSPSAVILFYLLHLSFQSQFLPPHSFSLFSGLVCFASPQREPAQPGVGVLLGSSTEAWLLRQVGKAR